MGGGFGVEFGEGGAHGAAVFELRQTFAVFLLVLLPRETYVVDFSKLQIQGTPHAYFLSNRTRNFVAFFHVVRLESPLSGHFSIQAANLYSDSLPCLPNSQTTLILIIIQLPRRLIHLLNLPPILRSHYTSSNQTACQ